MRIRSAYPRVDYRFCIALTGRINLGFEAKPGYCFYK